ncbi:MAG: hypothetical protein V4787_01880 [Pseudomonadota bacterium]
MAVTYFERPRFSRLIRRTAWILCLPACALHAQGTPTPPSACPAQPVYPLPTEPAKLQDLSDRLQELSIQKECLVDASFHAWRGAVFMALGRSLEAVEPLERALMANPDLPGAQLDLAQALALQGDKASAAAMLEGLRGRADVPLPLRTAINTQLAALAMPPEKIDATAQRWYTRVRLSSMLGADSNLNNAPSNSEITLTQPTGDVTLPLDPSSLARSGAAVLTSLQWQGLKPRGDSLWVVQAEVRARRTAERVTGYEQADVSAAWLQAPAAPAQWVARVSTSHLRFGGTPLLHALRASLQRQFSPFGGPLEPQEKGEAPRANCKPTLGFESEHRRYPSSESLTGLYTGVVAGALCTKVASGAASFVNMEARWGEDRPTDPTRAGGVYRRSEIRAQAERPVFANGQASLQWSTMRQVDSEPYNALLGNVPRTTLRHALQAEGAWPLSGALSLVSTAEAAWQRSNITAFISRQRSFYLGLRWELM